ncbi:glycosyltransferase family 2 protein [Caulobacter segnis]|uniref:glycosyltransferase family 2 protein n=1 Tax=Caulobacter segnis TaxID=88688 RepID=UPI0024100724|nr:glycosyltransferase family 2 protein [Caulobacter segnis]MDG2519941.1 glycosyltransferase family 2 protein [Caulobacter segnis]
MNVSVRPVSELIAGATPVTPGVSVVMVVYRTGEALASSIDQVLAEPMVDEFIIVDNGSDERDEQMLRTLERADPRVRLLQGHGNVGFAKGANMGARAAGGRHVVFLNPDAFLQPDCVRSLVQALKGRPIPSLVGACVINEDGTEQRGARRGEVTPWTSLLSFGQLSRRFSSLKRYEIHRETTDPLPTATVPTPTISGACFAMRREDFEALDGFDESFFLHVEDIDICWRARELGGEVLFQPAAKVVHLGHTSLKSPLFVEFHKGMGLARYFIKRAKSFGPRAAAVLLAPLVIGMAVSRPALWKLTGQRI